MDDVKIVCASHLSLIKSPIIVDHTMDDCEYCTKEWHASINQMAEANASWLMGGIHDLVIYIAGPMTGLPDFNRKRFWMMEHLLKLNGCKSVLTPARHPIDQPYEWYMRQGIKMVAQADAVVMLNGWNDSDGACLEYMVATSVGCELFYDLSVNEA